MRSTRLTAIFIISAAFLAGAPVLADGAAGTGAAPGAAAPAAPAATAPTSASAWQDVITGQIEAFRRGDAATAFGFAGSPFQKGFPDAASFMVAIAAGGYAPIFTSVSHSFGSFEQPDSKTVVQEVTLIGPKQEIFRAVYALTLESGGWRVAGVTLVKDKSIGV